MMQDLKIDYTLFFKQLENLQPSVDLSSHFAEVFYQPLSKEEFIIFENFIESYQKRLEKNTISPAESASLMQKNNPKFILRNYLLFQCIEELNEGKKELFLKLQKALQNPYDEIFPEFSKKRPVIYDGQAGCSTLSCSS